MVAGASGVLGLLASGLLLQGWSWPSVFWFKITAGRAALPGAAFTAVAAAVAVATLLHRRRKPADRTRRVKRQP